MNGKSENTSAKAKTPNNSNGTWILHQVSTVVLQDSGHTEAVGTKATHARPAGTRAVSNPIILL